MMNWKWMIVCAAAALPGVARADSIWDRRDPRYAFLFQDNQARQIGDILSVTISESTVAADQDQRALNKTGAASGSLSVFGFGTTSSNGTAATPGRSANGAFLPLPSANLTRSMTGNASLAVNRVFTDKIAMTVVDIMPNGNLVVEGYRSRVVAGEERVLRITGIVRQQDVGLGNTVQSQSVANFRISYLGRGPESRFANQNYLGRAFNLLWP